MLGWRTSFASLVCVCVCDLSAYMSACGCVVVLVRALVVRMGGCERRNLH